MESADQKPEVVLPAEVLEEMPLPSDRKATFLGGLFVLALLAAAYVASEIVLPLVFEWRQAGGHGTVAAGLADRRSGVWLLAPARANRKDQTIKGEPIDGFCGACRGRQLAIPDRC